MGTQKKQYGTTWRTDSHFQGIGNQAAYVNPGMPWTTGSQVDPSGSWERIDFPHVTQRVTVQNVDQYYTTNGQQSGSAPICVFFSSDEPTSTPPEQVNNQHAWYLTDTGEEKTFRVRTDHIYVANMSGFGGSTKSTGSFNVTAELANVDKTSMYELTGSGVNEI